MVHSNAGFNLVFYANINIDSSVKPQVVSVDTTNGDVDMKAMFETLHIDSHNGDIDINLTNMEM